MNKYEVIYIIDPKLEEEPRKELIARFSALVTENGGTLDKVEEWGMRRLAYEIDYKTEGYYVLLHLSAPSSFPKELERNFMIQDKVFRFLVIRLDEE